MRPVTAAAAALGALMLGLVPLGPIRAAQDDATPNLLTAQELEVTRVAGEGPLILRGSAMAPRRAAELQPVAPRWQLAAGRRLWLIDRVNQEVRACAVFNTTDVGVQEIGCVSQSTSGYARTFGPAFSP